MSDSTKKYMFLAVAIFISMMMIRNILFKDYKQATKDLLTDSGSDARTIEAYVPKTQAERVAEVLERNQRVDSIKELQFNVTALQDKVAYLEKLINTPHS